MKPTPIYDDLRAFVRTSRAFADENRVPVGDPCPPRQYRDDLCFKLRLASWSTALTYWYYVHQLAEGEWYRHLEIQMSIHSQGEPVSSHEVRAYKAQALQGLTAQVRLFFPLHDKVLSQVDVQTPVPVSNPSTKQLSFRTPIVFHFLVAADTASGAVGVSMGGGGVSKAGQLLGPDGRALRSSGYDNLAGTRKSSTGTNRVVALGADEDHDAR